jgi:hypothetical protein
MSAASLAARVDAIIASRDPAPARSFTFPVDCRECARSRRHTPGIEIVHSDDPTPIAGVARIHARCIRCDRHWTYTVTCTPTAAHLLDLEHAGAA